MSKFLHWIPAFIIMAIIFMASSTPSTQLPQYGIWDTLVKKGGHMTGYGLLAICLWYGFNFDRKKFWQAGVLALVYAATDEFHQIFTAGRHPSLVDVILFDGGGTLIGLLATLGFFRWKNRKIMKSA